MSDNAKKWIILVVAIVLVIIVGAVIVNVMNKDKNQGQDTNTTAQNEQNTEKYTTVLGDGTKLNTSDEFNKVKKYNNLEITDIQFTVRGGVSVLLANVKNTGSQKHEREVVTLYILGEDGKTITDIPAVIGEIEPNETFQLNSSITADVTNAKDFRIEASK